MSALSNPYPTQNGSSGSQRSSLLVVVVLGVVTVLDEEDEEASVLVDEGCVELSEVAMITIKRSNTSDAIKIPAISSWTTPCSSNFSPRPIVQFPC